jgi:hypothetical protein
MIVLNNGGKGRVTSRMVSAPFGQEGLNRWEGGGIAGYTVVYIYALKECRIAAHIDLASRQYGNTTACKPGPILSCE